MKPTKSKSSKSKFKQDPKYDFFIYECTIQGIFALNTKVLVLAKSITCAHETVPNATSIRQLDGLVAITLDVAKDIVRLQKGKWIK